MTSLQESQYTRNELRIRDVLQNACYIHHVPETDPETSLLISDALCVTPSPGFSPPMCTEGRVPAASAIRCAPCPTEDIQTKGVHTSLDRWSIVWGASIWKWKSLLWGWGVGKKKKKAARGSIVMRRAGLSWCINRRCIETPQDGGFSVGAGGSQQPDTKLAGWKREKAFPMTFSPAVLKVFSYNGHKSGTSGLWTLFKTGSGDTSYLLHFSFYTAAYAHACRSIGLS